MISTADISDQYGSSLSLLSLDLLSYGKKDGMAGHVVTLKVYEDNSYVRKVLSQAGNGNVLIVDGGGSRRCALVGDQIALLAIENRWEGIIVYGCIRDAKEINQMDISIKALGTCPVKSIKRDVGYPEQELIIGGTKISTGQYVYSDADGILLSEKELLI